MNLIYKHTSLRVFQAIGSLFLSLFFSIHIASAETESNKFHKILFHESLLQTELKESNDKLDGNAISVTVVDTNGETISAYAGENISAESLFQAASMSKTVTAVAVLILAYENQIELDEDIRPYVPSVNWKSLKGGDLPVSLRQLLSHTAGATVHGFPGYKKSKKIPNSKEVVHGGRGVNTPAIKFTKEKDVFSYSGGGYQVLQLFIEDTSKQSFEAFMKSTILDPLKMKNSTFKQPIEPSDIAPLTIAKAEIRKNKFGWHNYPEQAAAGLWTTSEDYMKFALVLLQMSQGSNVLNVPNNVLRPMLQEVDEEYGLGLILSLNKSGSINYFGHNGKNAGYHCIFKIYPERQIGIVMMTNSSKSNPLAKEIMMAADSHGGF